MKKLVFHAFSGISTCNGKLKFALPPPLESGRSASALLTGKRRSVNGGVAGSDCVEIQEIVNSPHCDVFVVKDGVKAAVRSGNRRSKTSGIQMRVM